MLTGNKGEWSEIYALFKLLGDRQLFIGDANLDKIEDIFYPIIKIIRKEYSGNFDYEINGDIVIISGGIEGLKVPIETFLTEASKLLLNIKESKGSFSNAETELFMASVNCKSLKAKSTSKSDIRIVIHDQRINQITELGFSIKSQLGGDATLLNAGTTTNFIFKIDSFSPSLSEINEINAIDTKSKIKDRIEEIKKRGGFLNFHTTENRIFRNNLILIDSLLPNILAEIIKTFFTTNLNSIKDLTKNIEKINPVNFDIQNEHLFYDYKIKRFLTDVALGMTPSKVWSGIYDATGGYLIVKENGDVICYHIYNRNLFEAYLFANTKLETASSSRHGFGKIFQQDENYFIKLNLQIRFK